MTEREVSSERVSEEKLAEVRGWCAERKAQKPWYGEGEDSPKMLTTCDFMISLIDDLIALRSSVKTVGVPEALEQLQKALAAKAASQSRRDEMLATLIVNLEKGEPTAKLAIALRDFVQRERPKLSAIEAPSEGEGPDFYAVHSVTGSHIGLWKDEVFARNVLKEYEGGTITPLYAHPSPAAPSEGTDAMVERFRAFVKEATGTELSLQIVERALTAALKEPRP